MELLKLTVGETFGLKNPKGKFGIEIEMEGERLSEEVSGKWSAKPDGSLRHGIEYVSTPTDTPRDDVNALAEELRGQGCVLQPTYRCSTHIHYNFVGKTWATVIGTVIAWNIIEPLFMRMMPPGRDGSIFCMSAYDTGDLPVFFHTFCDELNAKFRFKGFPAVCRQKYSSLNMTRLSDLGTLEFRVFPPSMDGREVRKWCNWIDNIVKLAEETDPDNFAKFVHQAEKRPEDFVQAIFKDQHVGDSIPAMIDLGCKTAYELVRAFNQAKKTKPKKAKSKLQIAEEMAGLRPMAFPDEENE